MIEIATITSAQVWDVMYKAGAQGAYTIKVDPIFACPAWDWVVNVYGPAFREDLARLGLTKYIKNTFDCDKYSALFYALSKLCHARTAPDSGVGFAIGWFMYTTRTGQGHAINFAISKGNGEFKVRFFEPQNQTEIFLIREELVGATYII